MARGKREYSAGEVEFQHRLGQQIKRLRVNAKLIQDDFADAAGLERSYIPALEAGKFDPRLSTLTRVARALGIGVDELLASTLAADEIHRK